MIFQFQPLNQPLTLFINVNNFLTIIKIGNIKLPNSKKNNVLTADFNSCLSRKTFRLPESFNNNIYHNFFNTIIFLNAQHTHTNSKLIFKSKYWIYPLVSKCLKYKNLSDLVWRINIIRILAWFFNLKYVLIELTESNPSIKYIFCCDIFWNVLQNYGLF